MAQAAEVLNETSKKAAEGMDDLLKELQGMDKSKMDPQKVLEFQLKLHQFIQTFELSSSMSAALHQSCLTGTRNLK